MSTVVLAKTDLSSLRLVAPDNQAAFEPAPIAEDEPSEARALRQRAEDAATWLAAQPGVRRRLHHAILDVDDALCAWIKAPSRARPVVLAALRGLIQEWGDEHLTDAVEMLTDPESSPKQSTLMSLVRRARTQDESEDGAAAPLEPARRSSSLPVISLPDALARLWLDALDRRSVRVSRVVTLWHALAAAWAPRDEEITGVVLIDGGRLVWSWSRGEDLLAGGAVDVDGAHGADPEEEAKDAIDPIDAAARRLSLDWLAWSSQLTLMPDRLVFVGSDAGAWAEGFTNRWARIETTTERTGDPIAATLEALAQIEPDASTPRRCLASISDRPTRALRARYQLAGVAMVLLLLAVSSVSFRLWQKAGQWRDQATVLRDESIQIVRDTWPALTDARITNPDRTAQTKVQELLIKEAPDKPPRPRPLPDALMQIVSIFAAEDLPEEIRIAHIELDQDDANELRYSVPDRLTGAEILKRLREKNPDIEWSARARGDVLTPILMGDWILR